MYRLNRPRADSFQVCTDGIAAVADMKDGEIPRNEAVKFRLLHLPRPPVSDSKYENDADNASEASKSRQSTSLSRHGK
jgi:hypothetical protein